MLRVNAMQRRLLTSVLALAAAACGGADRPSAMGALPVVVTVAAVGTPIATVTLEVSAADISEPLVFNLSLTGNTAARTLAIPAGPARLFTARAFDTTGAITHEGSTTIDVLPGQNPSLSIQMVPRPGQVPISIQIGPVTVVVDPTSATVSVGSSTALTAEVRAPNGDVLSVPVEWASANPALVTVSNGLVQAVARGETDVVATCLGSAGRSHITVP